MLEFVHMNNTSIFSSIFFSYMRQEKEYTGFLCLLHHLLKRWNGYWWTKIEALNHVTPHLFQ